MNFPMDAANAMLGFASSFLGASFRFVSFFFIGLRNNHMEESY